MKIKVLCILLSGLILLTLTGCVSKPAEDPSSSSSAASTSSTVSGEPVIPEGGIDVQNEFLNSADNTTPSDELITQSFPANSLYGKGGFAGYFSVKYHMYMSHQHALYKIDAVNQIAAVECVRYMGDNNFYAVFDVAEGGKLFSFFPNGQAPHNNFLSHSVWVKEPLNRSDFNNLKIGDSLQDVIAIDPMLKYGQEKGMNCNIFYEHNDNSSTPYSVHLFENCLMVIKYKEVERGNSVFDDLQITIQDITVCEDFTVVLESGSAAGGSYDYSILKQDMVK